MLNMQTKISGNKKLAAKLKRTGRRMDSQMERSMQKALNIVLRSAKQHLTGGLPLNVRSGRLRGSVTTRISKKSSGSLSGAVGSNVIYAPVHEYGAEIRAKNAEYMTFKYKGMWYRLKEVTIPKRPWLGPAFESNVTRINQVFGRDVTGLLRRERLA